MAVTRVRIPRSVGVGAGLLALALVIYSVAGAVWGLFRPELTGRLVDGSEGGYSIDSLADVEFVSFGSFALLTGVIGLVLGICSYWRAARQRGLAMLLWTGLSALAGAYAFWVFGSATAAAIPTEPGEVVHWVPPFAPGMGLVAAPFAAMFVYWSAAFISADEDWNTGNGIFS